MGNRFRRRIRRRIRKIIRLTERARIIEKNDATRVARRDTLKKAHVKTVLPTNGITFKVKIRKK